MNLEVRVVLLRITRFKPSDNRSDVCRDLTTNSTVGTALSTLTHVMDRIELGATPQSGMYCRLVDFDACEWIEYDCKTGAGTTHFGFVNTDGDKPYRLKARWHRVFAQTCGEVPNLVLPMVIPELRRDALQ